MDESQVGPHVPSTLAPPPERDAQIEVASQWQLMWWRFKQHKVALASAIVVVLIYVVALIPEFLAPYPSDVVNARYLYAPPQPLQLFSTDGGLRFEPHVVGYRSVVDAAAGRRTFTTDDSLIIPAGLFVQGAPYKLFGLIPMDRHLFGPVDASQPMYLLGADRLGGDLLSKMIYGTRISMSIGLVGVALSLSLGIVLG